MFVRVRLLEFSTTYTRPLVSPLLRVTVPPPCSVVFELMPRDVLWPLPASSWRFPRLVMVPRSDVVVPKPPV